MSGHIRRRGENSWELKFSLGKDPVTGKRKNAYVNFKGTKADAKIALVQQLAAQSRGEYIKPSKTTVAEFLEQWLTDKKPNVAPLTFERYQDIVRKNIAPLLGAVILSKLQSAHITKAYSKALATGRRDGKGGLSARTVHHMHRILKQALSQAVRWNMLVKNPADLDKKDRPKVEKKTVATIDAAGTAQAIEAARAGTARELRLFVPILFGSMAGARRGEICAFRWKSIDLKRGQAAVIASIEQTKAGCREKETKGSKCRTIALPALVVEELEAWRIRQAQELLKLGIRPDGDTFVVTQPDGAGYQPRSLTHAVSAFMKAHGIKVRLHGLRHSHASHLLAENVHPKVVQERLGHSSIAITMDIYSHLMPNMQTDAAAKIDAAFKSLKR